MLQRAPFCIAAQAAARVVSYGMNNAISGASAFTPHTSHAQIVITAVQYCSPSVSVRSPSGSIGRSWLWRILQWEVERARVASSLSTVLGAPATHIGALGIARSPALSLEVPERRLVVPPRRASTSGSSPPGRISCSALGCPGRRVFRAQSRIAAVDWPGTQLILSRRRLTSGVGWVEMQFGVRCVTQNSL